MSVSGLAGCTAEQRHSDGVTPREELFLLFPRMEKRIVLRVSGAEPLMDFGLDYDGPAGDLSLTVEGPDRTAWKGARLAGSNMRLVVCGVPATGGPITVILRNHVTASRLAALRVAPNKSDMCTPMSPVMDEYWASLGRPAGTPAGVLAAKTVQTQAKAPWGAPPWKRSPPWRGSPP
ncbi:MAG: hypothetical protein CVU59_11965 [Deltaproteobacteria bacterium HGW-Deltaproteobacteria-17]|nr:MAG: hypothetical protein CVU59_11965 [Deltaproteobacteria bacterium HGW-Deltaproteobacteria-17]